MPESSGENENILDAAAHRSLGAKGALRIKSKFAVMTITTTSLIFFMRGLNPPIKVRPGIKIEHKRTIGREKVAKPKMVLVSSLKCAPQQPVSPIICLGSYSIMLASLLFPPFL